MNSSTLYSVIEIQVITILPIAEIPISKFQKKQQFLPNFPNPCAIIIQLSRSRITRNSQFPRCAPRLIILPTSCGAQVAHVRAWPNSSLYRYRDRGLPPGPSIPPRWILPGWIHERRYRGGALVDTVRVWPGKARAIGNRASSGGRYSAGNTTSRQADGVGMVC